MSETKKNAPVFEDPVNGKIQRQFNLVFGEKDSSKAKSPNENAKQDDSMANDSSAKKKDNETVAPTTISLDLADSDTVISQSPGANTNVTTATKNAALDFTLNFDQDDTVETAIESKPSASQAPTSTDAAAGGFVLDDADLGGMEFDNESTKQTLIMNVGNLQDSTRVVEKETPKEENVTAFDLMSTAEAKANIESTIKDILRPKFESTQEINISDMALGTDIHNIEDSVLDLGGNTPAKGTALKDVAGDDFSFDEPEESTQVEAKEMPVAKNQVDEKALDDDFSLLGDDDDLSGSNVSDPSFSTNMEPSFSTNSEPSFSKDLGSLTAVTSLEALEGFEATSTSDDEADTESLFEAPSFSEEVTAPKVQHYSSGSSKGKSSSEDNYVPGSMSTEDSMRTQATIRALREERESLLAQIKTLKNDNRELEQDNLTLKANLDEAKIEITILRKRQMVELEDIKYRLTMSEEKKAMAEEKARQSEIQRSKLEQKVRIDFNQVKQREKELESKLELLSMDVDSQVQSRDHKILELRRKIDALEFNMENASIKEQKSLDDKRKLEDRLNKIMKTLRHSIKNLEDDIDHAVEDSDHQKGKSK
jgi:hypothetical protein